MSQVLTLATLIPEFRLNRCWSILKLEQSCHGFAGLERELQHKSMIHFRRDFATQPIAKRRRGKTSSATTQTIKAGQE